MEGNAWGGSHKVRSEHPSKMRQSIVKFFLYLGVPFCWTDWLLYCDLSVNLKSWHFLSKLIGLFLLLSIHCALELVLLTFRFDVSLCDEKNEKWRIMVKSYVCSENFWGTILIRLMVNTVSALRITIQFLQGVPIEKWLYRVY